MQRLLLLVSLLIILFFSIGFFTNDAWQSSLLAQLGMNDKAQTPAPRKLATVDELEALSLRLTAMDSALKTQLNGMQNTISQLNQQIRLTPTIQGGAIIIKRGEMSWRLEDLFSRRRTYQRPVRFNTPFSNTPTVILGITMIESTSEEGRYSVHAKDITKQGFNLSFETLAELKPHESHINWLAYSAGVASPTPNPTTNGSH
ncbi:MAG: H-type lectin domain-containing protein [Magnetococcales bacterium]|nr:H-type lectin domain-containing protein [Magnetococcales bacterium]